MHIYIFPSKAVEEPERASHLEEMCLCSFKVDEVNPIKMGRSQRGLSKMARRHMTLLNIAINEGYISYSHREVLIEIDQDT